MAELASNAQRQHLRSASGASCESKKWDTGDSPLRSVFIVQQVHKFSRTERALEVGTNLGFLRCPR
jgi:hypothetical protein